MMLEKRSYLVRLLQQMLQKNDMNIKSFSLNNIKGIKSDRNDRNDRNDIKTASYKEKEENSGYQEIFCNTYLKRKTSSLMMLE